MSCGGENFPWDRLPAYDNEWRGQKRLASNPASNAASKTQPRYIWRRWNCIGSCLRASPVCTWILSLSLLMCTERQPIFHSRVITILGVEAAVMIVTCFPSYRVAQEDWKRRGSWLKGPNRVAPDDFNWVDPGWLVQTGWLRKICCCTDQAWPERCYSSRRRRPHRSFMQFSQKCVYINSVVVPLGNSPERYITPWGWPRGQSCHNWWEM